MVMKLLGTYSIAFGVNSMGFVIAVYLWHYAPAAYFNWYIGLGILTGIINAICLHVKEK
jgi:hypothetical protein